MFSSAYAIFSKLDLSSHWSKFVTPTKLLIGQICTVFAIMVAGVRACSAAKPS